MLAKNEKLLLKRFFISVDLVNYKSINNIRVINEFITM